MAFYLYIGLSLLNLDYNAFLMLTPNIMFKMFINYLKTENPGVLNDKNNSEFKDGFI